MLSSRNNLAYQEKMDRRPRVQLSTKWWAQRSSLELVEQGLQNVSGKKMYMTRKNSEIWYYPEKVGISSCKKCSNAGNGVGRKRQLEIPRNTQEYVKKMCNRSILCGWTVNNLYIEKCCKHCWPICSFWNQPSGQAKRRLRSGGRTRFMFSFLTT